MSYRSVVNGLGPVHFPYENGVDDTAAADLTVVGAVRSTTDTPGAGIPDFYSFDGVDDHLWGADGAPFDQSLDHTVVWWYRIGSATGSDSFANHWAKGDNGYQARLEGTTESAIRYDVRGAGANEVVIATGLPVDGTTWVMMVARWNSTNIELFRVTGTGAASQGSVARADVNVTNTDQRWSVGCQYDAGAPRRFIEADIVPPVLFDFALSTVQMESIFDAKDDPEGGGQTIPLGRAVETDVARGLTAVNPRTHTLGRTVEVDAARPLTVVQPQTVTLGRASETDVVRPTSVVNPRTVALGRAVEADVARSAAVVNPRTYLLGRTAETNAARPVTVDNPRTVVLGRATETDSARPLTISQPGAVILGRAVESDVARGLTVVNPRSYLLGRTIEADTARPVVVRQGTTVPLGRATEANFARPLTVSNPRTYLLARAAEVDAARTLATVNPRTIVLGRATESDVARTLAAHVGDPVVFVAPADRTLTVAAEDRTFVVAAEDRTMLVGAESRTLTVTR